MAQIRTPFLIFMALLLSSTSLVDAIRPQKQNPETPSVFSLPLSPRDSLTNLQNQNFTARTISRLDGDTARVKHINSRLRKALFNSDNPNFQLEDFQSPLSFLGGGYVTRIGVGEPVQEFDMLADTGSDINWLQCESCTQCYPQFGQKFDPSQSSTYQHLLCPSEQCKSLSRSTCSDTGTCIYITSYGAGSLASQSMGEFATETFSFGSSGTARNVALGCGLDNEGHLSGIAGILGLGFSKIALPSQIQATSFSYCLVGGDSKSSSTLEFNSAPPGDSITVPLRTNPRNNLVYYYVELSGITVGEDQIQIPPSVYQIGGDGRGGIIIDSGTTFTFLDSDVYTSVRDAFRKYTQNLAPFSFRNYETCYDVPSGSASSLDYPSMSLQFSNGQSTPPLGPDNYLFRAAGSTFCLAFTPSDSNDVVSILGNVQQSGMRITYELDKKLIGFSPKKC